MAWRTDSTVRARRAAKKYEGSGGERVHFAVSRVIALRRAFPVFIERIHIANIVVRKRHAPEAA